MNFNLPLEKVVERFAARPLGEMTNQWREFVKSMGQGDEFELYSSDQHVRFCCREMSGDDMNTLIDTAAEFECPLYDPQEDRRFDGHVA